MMTEPRVATAPMFEGAPPAWALRRDKPIWQRAYDFLGAPLRMALFPDHVSERWRLTSLRAERLGVVLNVIEGRCLDIGAGDNMLIKLYRETGADHQAAEDSIGLDVVDWGADCVIVPDCKTLPFDDASFDTVTLVACLNHIPERAEALKEACRVLRPGGKVVVTMIGRFIGVVGHAIWWYSEDKHRDIAPGEVMGMASSDVHRLLDEAGLVNIDETGFVYGLNRLIVGHKPSVNGL